MAELPTTLTQWLDHQQRQHPQTIELGLARVREVAQRLGLLAPGCPVITVAGTNGKGSTAHTCAALLTAMGRRTGLFTSPHLLRYTERIRIDGAQIDEPTLLAAFAAIEARRGATPLTFFEYNTLAALWCFRARATTAIVLEVGLGGRLDASNIIDADVAVICSIGLDHTDWLGSTLAAIGAEKAGILRAGRPVVFGTQALPDSVWQQAAALACPVRCAEREFTWQVGAAGRWRFSCGALRLDDLPAPALAGDIQYRNAATALAAVLALPGVPPPTAMQVAAGLAAVQLAGRLQVIPGPVEWILDVAHNVAAAGVLAGALAARPCAGRTLAVFAALTDKDAPGIVAALAAQVDAWILCDLHEARGQRAHELQQRVGRWPAEVTLAADVGAGCELARQRARAGDRIVVCGSFHVVGPALAWLGLY